MLARDRRDRVIGDARDFNRVLALEAIRAGRGNRQHVDIDAQLIHVL